MIMILCFKIMDLLVETPIATIIATLGELSYLFELLIIEYINFRVGVHFLFSLKANSAI